MSSTFTAPIRVNTRQTTSNDGTISADNTGAAVLTQQAAFVTAAASTVVIPAGSIIHSIQAYVNDSASSRTLSLTVNGVTTSVGTISTAALGVASAVFTASATVANLLANVGPYNCTVTLGAEASSAGTLSVMYTARNSDGTITPYGSGYTNN
ncbi:hypothetical protein UFOVP1640_23 [uncultured Caudovirales phage]|jgi:hypothetical protein|uniref:Uncharacterized protein n=1 Tax=uncultured Caudovirales phage TaxID=2100421 RepID=A0A6J5RMP7_9CAUD|nr:hypothetical protein UFOVP1286_26 [uncultured Caudovirales phage]CAB4205565.1 hypothetical protein UFOVP1407_56 [uncultured Caudovirales phage]CAB4221622.1 hypothetical protein UFOVP1640_23 [uncultured Caudovirales phage]